MRDLALGVNHKIAYPGEHPLIREQQKKIVNAINSFAEETDIKRMKKTRSYRGVRHGMGLPVRGQRTKSNFRKNKGKASLGVAKKAAAKAGRV